MSEPDFYKDMLEGNLMKELVKALLESSGYSVFPYGYESTLSDIRKKLHAESPRRAREISRTEHRIRSSPDLLVYDKSVNDLMLVEVKMRRAQKVTNIHRLKIGLYKEFWDDSFLVVVVPCGNVFYAQKVGELEDLETHDATIDFKRFEDVFTRVKPEDISYFRDKALLIMEE